MYECVSRQHSELFDTPAAGSSGLNKLLHTIIPSNTDTHTYTDTNMHADMQTNTHIHTLLLTLEHTHHLNTEIHLEYFQNCTHTNLSTHNLKMFQSIRVLREVTRDTL